MLRVKFIIPIVFLAIISSGCASQSTIQTEINNDVASTQSKIDSHRSEMQKTPASKQGGVVMDSYPWVSTTKVRYREKLPSIFFKPIVLFEPNPTSAQRLLAKVSEMVGIEIVVENDVFESRRHEQVSSGRPASSDSTNQTQNVTKDIGVSSVFRMQDAQDVQISLTYKGDVRGLMDAIANGLRINWRYDSESNRIIFYKFETKTFKIAILPGDTSITGGVASKSGGLEMGSKVAGDLSFWKSIKETIAGTISAQGAFHLSESIGLLTVRDRPDVLARISDYIDRVNENFSRQVTIDVKVFRISLTDEQRRAFNTELMRLGSRFGINFTTVRPDTTVGGWGSFKITIPEDVLYPGLEKWAGTSFFLDFLNSIGKTTVETSSTLHTINNQPVPLRVVRRTKYLEEVSVTASNGGVTQASLKPGEVNAGFSMQILPQVQDNGKDVVMQVSMSLTSLDRIDQFTSNGSTIQLPQTSERDFMQRVWLRSGEALVLVGFENVEGSINNDGLIPNSWIFGRNNASQTKESLLIVLTPSVRAMDSRG